MAQSDMFLKFSIPTFIGGGGSTDASVSGDQSWQQIEIQSFSINIAHVASVRGGSGHEIDAIVHNPVTVTKFMDGSSPTFLQACCSGAQSPNIQIECYCIDTAAGDGSKKKWLTINLMMALISGYRPQASAGNLPPTEEIDITYGGIHMVYDFGERTNMHGGWLLFTQTPTGAGIASV